MHNSVLFTSLFSASTFLSYSALAACTANPDCAALGYTKSSCPSGDLVLRCPFNTAKVNCIPLTCETIGKKTCGDICIKASSCCSDSDCTGGKKCTSDNICSMVCAVGDIYYSDKTCSADLISGKTPIGVVGYVKEEGKHGGVISLENAGGGLEWGCYAKDLSLPNFTSQSAAMEELDGKLYTEKIVTTCGGAAASFCNSYSKNGIGGWYLPAFGELFSVMDKNFSLVNYGLGKISASNKIEGRFWHWSSSEYNGNYALYINAGGSGWGWNQKNNNQGSVRCMLGF